MEKTQNEENSQPIAVWRLNRWCEQAGISRPTFYNLPPDARPKSTKVGDRRLVIESPSDWINRIASVGGVNTIRREEV